MSAAVSTEVNESAENRSAEPPADSEASSPNGPEGLRVTRPWRVKLYKMNGARQWDDLGTGWVSCYHQEKWGTTVLHMVPDEEGVMVSHKPAILDTKIQDDDIYQRQGDSIISWKEPDVGKHAGSDLALSFQENAGCLDIWSQICNVQGKFPVDLDDIRSRSSVDETNSEVLEVNLPKPEIANLGEIASCFTGLQEKGAGIAKVLLQEDGAYIAKLLSIFDDLEDFENSEGLRQMFDIFRGMVMLDNQSLLELLMSDRFCIPVFGVFEYDPNMVVKPDHRSYLQNEVRFNQVVQISQPDIESKIHSTFRIGLLKDVVLRRTLDDSTFSMLNSLIFLNNVEIVTALYTDQSYMTSLFSTLEKSDRVNRWQGLALLRELCMLSRNLQATHRDAFQRRVLENTPVFDALNSALEDEESPINARLHALEILSASIAHNAELVIKYVISSGNHPAAPSFGGFGVVTSISSKIANSGNNLLYNVIRRLSRDRDIGVLAHASDVIRLLLDPSGAEGSLRDEFFGLFYDYYVFWLLEPIMTEHDTRPLEGAAAAAAARRSYVCEILCFCVNMHGYRIKYFIMRQNTAVKVLNLLKFRDKFVKLAAIRFLRTCVGTKDKFYIQYLVKNNLFAPLFQLFKENADKNNLINSAIIELLEFVKTENLEVLIKYIVENFASYFESITYVTTFNMLVNKYQQMDEVAKPATSEVTVAAPVSEAPNRRKAVEDEDDSYFNEGDEDTENTGPPPADDDDYCPTPPTRLVAYPDEDEEKTFTKTPVRGKRNGQGQAKTKMVVIAPALPKTERPEEGTENGLPSSPLKKQRTDS